MSDRELLGESLSRHELMSKAVDRLKERYRPFFERRKLTFPEVRVIEGRIVVEGRPVNGCFSVDDGKPVVSISGHSNSWIITLFHEFQHYMRWVRDPSPAESGSLRNIDETFTESDAISDWNDFVRFLERDDLVITGGQYATYIRRLYGSQSWL